MEQEMENHRWTALQRQTQKLRQLQSQMVSIKNSVLLKDVFVSMEIDALCIIQNDKTVFELFINNEANILFAFLPTTFEERCRRLYHQHVAARPTQDNIMHSTFSLVDVKYTLFIKPLQTCTQPSDDDKHLIFLLRSKQNINVSELLHSLDLLLLIQSIIGKIYHSTQMQADICRHQSRLTLTTLIEIATEIFGGVDGGSEDSDHGSSNSGNQEEMLALDEVEFTTAMRLRLGLESVWSDGTTRILQTLFATIVDHLDSTEIVCYHGNVCLLFDQFVAYFSDERHQQTVLQLWTDIKYAVQISPLSAKNKTRRDKRGRSVSQTKQKLSEMEKMVNLLEEALLSRRSSNNHVNGSHRHSLSTAMSESQHRFWRSTILSYREAVRKLSDAMLAMILHENDRMKQTMLQLMSSNEDKLQLLNLNQRLCALLQKHKEQQVMMKQCEREIRQQNEAIFALKAELMTYKSPEMSCVVQSDASAPDVNSAVNRLKGQIAEKKLNIQKQIHLLAPITENFDSFNSR